MASYTEMYNMGMVPSGSRVVAIVSKGPNPTQTPYKTAAPDVGEKSQGAALEAMSKSGFQTQVVYDYHKTARKGEVVAQYPSASVPADQGSQALIIVSSGQALNEQAAVKIPLVQGKSESDAVETLRAAGLSPQVMYDFDPAVPAGIVIDQLPNQSTYATGKAKKSTVSWVLIVVLAILIVLGGYFAATKVPEIIENRKTVVTVPSVVGKPQSVAEEMLIEAKLEVGTVETIDRQDESNVPGTVVSTDPSAKETVAKGSKVNLVVYGDGLLEEPMQKVEVPNVVSMTSEDAQSLLEGLGLEPVIKESTNEAPSGSVFGQDPRAGVKVDVGSKVTMLVSTGPAVSNLVEVPSVIGSSEEDAKRLLTERGLQVLVEESSNAAPSGEVFSQTPSSGSKVDPDTTVTITISTGPAGGETEDDGL